MEAIKYLCRRYADRLISVDDLRKGLIHEIGRASKADVGLIALRILSSGSERDES